MLLDAPLAVVGRCAVQCIECVVAQSVASCLH